MQILLETNDNYNTEVKTERLNPLNDFIFKQYMGTEEYKGCLLSFLNAVLYGTTLKQKITEVEIVENLELPKETLEGKFSRLDVRAFLPDDTQINIEVQLLKKGNMVLRSQYYNGRMFVSGINSGDEYDSLKKVISINILDFDLHEFPEFHISSHFRIDQYPKSILSEAQEIHFIELKKFLRSNQHDRNNPLHRWLMFFDRNLKEDELKELIQMDGAIAAAEERTRRVAASEEEMRYYEALEDARRDYISVQRYAFKEGKAEGIEEGKAEEEARLSELMDRLSQDKRMAEFIQAIKNPELKEKLYKEYGLTK